MKTSNILNKYNLRKLLQLQFATDEIRKLEERNVTELTDVLLTQLVEYVKIITNNWGKGDIDWLLDIPSVSLCGCMGPQDGLPYCGCRMRLLVYEYRYNIALVLAGRKHCDNLKAAVLK